MPAIKYINKSKYQIITLDLVNYAHIILSTLIISTVITYSVYIMLRINNITIISKTLIFGCASAVFLITFVYGLYKTHSWYVDLKDFFFSRDFFGKREKVFFNPKKSISLFVHRSPPSIPIYSVHASLDGNIIYLASFYKKSSAEKFISELKQFFSSKQVAVSNDL